MNYTINYPAGGNIGQASVQGQRTIVLTPPSQSQQPNSNGNNGGSNQFPMVMQVGSTGGPFFYTYQNTDGIANKSIESNSSANSGIGQVMLSSVSPVQNTVSIHGNNSPKVPRLNIRTDVKSGTARPLGEMFNMQVVSGLPNSGAMVQSRNVGCNTPVTQQPQHSGV